MLPTLLLNYLQQLGVSCMDERRVIPLFNEWAKNLLYFIEIDNHSMIIRRPFNFDHHAIGMPMQVAAKAVVPRKSMSALPSKCLGNGHNR
jgi:hypothetical protein